MTPIQTRLALLVLPLCFIITALILRQHAGPFWLWSNLDPDYWYLFDSLNMVNLNWPLHIAHPGTTTQVIGAVVIKILHPLASTGEINTLVLTDPERYLTLIGRVLIGINGIALLVAGTVAYRTFGSIAGAMLLQLGPFLSQLTFKHMLHVSPEPLLLTTMLMMATTVLLALRPGEIDRRPFRYVIAFAAIAGFGMATKVTSAGMYLIPLFLLGRPRLLFSYAAASVVFIVFFTLPAAGSYGLMFDWLTMIGSGSGHFGGGEKTFIDFATYPHNLLKATSRPVFFMVLFVGIVLAVMARRRATASPTTSFLTARAMAGLCLAFAAQGLLVAKHPAGHYMIPALVTSGLGFMLIHQLLRELSLDGGKARYAIRVGFSILLIALMVAQGRMIFKLDTELSYRSYQASVIDESPYAACARIYFWPASSIYFALHQGSYMTGKTFAAELKSLHPDPTILYSAPDGTITDWTSVRQPEDINKDYPCIFARGGGGFQLYRATREYVLPFNHMPFTDRKIYGYCPNWNQVILTWGIECIKTR